MPISVAQIRQIMKLSISSAWSGLPEETVSQLAAQATARHLNSGDLLFEAGDVGDGCYRLDKGVLKVRLTSPQGAERIIAVLGEGSIVGDLAMIDGLPRSASVVALTDCELRFISREAFQEYTKWHPEIQAFLVKVLARRLRGTDDTIAALAFLTATGRVANALLELAGVLGKKTNTGSVVISNMLSQKDLAAFAGVSRENTNRILRRLQDKEAFVKSSTGYRLDVAKLQEALAWEE